VTEIAPWLSPEEIKQLPGNVVTRALGMGPDVVVDLLTADTKVGDTYLLCSDGLNGMLSDEEIFQVTSKSSSPEERCEELIERANLAGGNDNTTVVLITVGEDGGEPDSEEMAKPQTGGAVSTLQLDFDDEEDTERHESTYESDKNGSDGAEHDGPSSSDGPAEVSSETPSGEN
jgi:serine/threonine protein phosphatase PrpC